MIPRVDVKEEAPAVKTKVHRVGFSGVAAPAQVIVGGRPARVNLVFDAYVDLPGSLRGIHASRVYESIVSVTNQTLGGDQQAQHIEELCYQVARELLKRHEYSRVSMVRARGDTLVESNTPITNKLAYQRLRVIGFVVAKAGGSLRRCVGVVTPSVLACPSAQRSIAISLVENEHLDQGRVSRIPVATHMQRGYAKILIESAPGITIDPLKLAEIAWGSASSMVYGLLKKKDEQELVKRALKETRLAEDVVRLMARSVVEAFPEVPDHARVVLEYRSLESIHDHDLVASIKSSMGELRGVVAGP